ncbi:pseudouridine synthase [Prosthecobacter algae]|uniref:Pseudouridine synthase n=1 Tax=Prosthecobacter algae TaxID=1144682 RepID=A0ABP9PEJ6_9BACT
MTRTGLARALSKLGHCSRSQGFALIKAGQVTLNGRICRDPEQPVRLGQDVIQVAGDAVAAAARVYVMLNKPRGLVTTASDEEGRATVYECFQEAGLPHVSPVGRLDKASEGLLLFTNDNAWANGITDPETHVEKTYHVQVASLVDENLLQRLRVGVRVDGESLRLLRVSVLRQGEKNSWLDVTLDEGKNRHIRRVLEVHGLEVLRLVRVSVGSLVLGELGKGSWRHLLPVEVRALSRKPR